MNPEVILQLVHDLTARALTAEQQARALAKQLSALQTQLRAQSADEPEHVPGTWCEGQVP